MVAIATQQVSQLVTAGVAPGQVFWAKSPRGDRYVRVVEVCSPEQNAYALVREVGADGAPVNDISFVSYLVWRGQSWSMRPSYTEVSR